MERSRIPLHALRAFEAAARHLNFTRAALELKVSQTALSHQIIALEERLGFALFRRLPRGVALTDEGAALAPAVHDAFERIGIALDRSIDGRGREVVTIGVVSSFAVTWLLPRLPDFEAAHPQIDLRVLANNNRADLAGEGLDLAIRFGDGAWHGVDAAEIMPAPLTALCAPALAARIGDLDDLARHRLLRSYRADEWSRFFAVRGLPGPTLRGPVFDNSIAIAQAAADGLGIALLPARLFGADIAAGRLVAPFPEAIDVGRYWLTRLQSRRDTPGMAAFRSWLIDAVRADRSPATPQAI